MTEWVLQNASDQMAALKENRVSAVELLEQTIARANSVSQTVNPLALELFERAGQKAAQADRLLKKKQGGPLCGLPVTVKDSQWLAGERCANGSMTLEEFVPDETCAAIDRLEQAGAVIFAKTTCPEFSLSGTNHSPLYGHTLNPWDLSRTPGGSSGGAAAAVASGVGALSLGGDGGGSIRIPASFCGVVGFKPSHGVVPRSPGFTTWESLVAYGPICRSVRDARLMFSVLSDIPQDINARAGRSDLKIIASDDLGFAPLDHDVRVTFENVVEKIRQADIDVVHGHPGLESSVVTWATIATSDMWQHKGRRNAKQHHADTESMGPYARDFLAFGSQFSELEIEDAHSRRNDIFQAYQALFQRHRSRILITPTMGCEAFHHSRFSPHAIGETEIALPWLDWAGFLYDANLVGMPACTIPVGIGDEGMPVSLQVTGPPDSDWEVLEVAERIESIIGWEHRVAPGYSGKSEALAESVLLQNHHAVPHSEILAGH